MGPLRWASLDFRICGRSSLFDSCRETSWNDGIVYSDLVLADNGGQRRTNQVQVSCEKRENPTGSPQDLLGNCFLIYTRTHFVQFC